MTGAGGSVTARTVADECALLPPVTAATTDDSSHEMAPAPIQRMNDGSVKPVRSE